MQIIGRYPKGMLKFSSERRKFRELNTSNPQHVIWNARRVTWNRKKRQRGIIIGVGHF